MSSFAVVSDGSVSDAGAAPATKVSSAPFSPVPPLPGGLRGHLLVVAGRLALATGRYPEAVRHVKSAVRVATDGVFNHSISNSVAPHERCDGHYV